MKKLTVILSVIAVLIAVTIMSTAVVGAQDNNNAKPNTSLFATKLASILGLSPASVSEAIKQTKEELRSQSGKTQKHKYNKDMGARLRKAIEDGKITREEAADRLKGLASNHQQLHKKPNKLGYPNADDINKKLEALVQDGKITREEADQKMKFHSGKAQKGLDLRTRLGIAIENGDITREAAAARMKGLESRR